MSIKHYHFIRKYDNFDLLSLFFKNLQEFVQYKTDIDNLIAEKNELSASYTSSAEYNVFDTNEMSASEVGVY